MECKFKGVARIKLFITGRKDFLYFDLPQNMKIENLKAVIATMYNFDAKHLCLYTNNISLDDYKGKTLEQLSKGQEVCIILMLSNNSKNISATSNHFF
jgi:hypothetical protein